MLKLCDECLLGGRCSRVIYWMEQSPTRGCSEVHRHERKRFLARWRNPQPIVPARRRTRVMDETVVAAYCTLTL